MTDQTETSEAVSSEKSGGQFVFGDWRPIETHSTSDPSHFDAFTVMRENGVQVGDGVRRPDVRWSLTNQRFEDTRGQPVEVIDGGVAIFITHWMPLPPPPNSIPPSIEAKSE